LALKYRSRIPLDSCPEEGVFGTTGLLSGMKESYKKGESESILALSLAAAARSLDVFAAADTFAVRRDLRVDTKLVLCFELGRRDYSSTIRFIGKP
jgi:hypothetical protein